MLECKFAGFDWDDIYNWNVDEFEEVYHGIKRKDARDALSEFNCLRHAFGGDKTTNKDYVDALSAWLPVEERQGGAKGADEFAKVIQKGVKLKKG